MKLVIKIDMDKPGFRLNKKAEAARLLRAAADAVEAGCIRAHLKDSSESVAGSLEISGRSAFDRRTYAPKE